MARRGRRSSCDESDASDSWMVEWTCVATAIFVSFLFSQIGRFGSPWFVGQCTTLSGMCTPTQCSCTFPQQKRELITQDSQVCHQCVTDFCPSVASGDIDCATSDCECEDPSWPRVNLPVDGQACWQCIRPLQDFSLRIGGQEGYCLVLANTPAEQQQLPGSRRLKLARNSSSCITFRYNGGRLMEKGQNDSCLVWQPFGTAWGLSSCNVREELQQFSQLPAPEGLEEAAPWAEIYCSGHNSSQFCIEVASTYCTEEDGRCTSEGCQCEDPTWTRHELQRLNGSRCYSCAPASRFCGVSEGECTLQPCECEDPSHVKVLAPAVAGRPREACFSCQAPSGRSGVATLATLVIFVLLGLVGGCGIRRLWENSARVSAKVSPNERPRRQALEAKPWSERAAEELEDLLETLYEVCIENPVLFYRWMRPYIRQVINVLSEWIDAFDDALEPLYTVINSVQNWIWQLLVVVCEHLASFGGSAMERMSDAYSWLELSQWRKSEQRLKQARVAKGRRFRCKEEGADAPGNAETAANWKSCGRDLASKSSPGRPAAPLSVASAGAAAANAAEDSLSMKDALRWDPMGGSGSLNLPRQTPQSVVHRSAETASVSRVQRKLQQRREAQAQAAQAVTPVTLRSTEAIQEAMPIDDSWIEELEQEQMTKEMTKDKASNQAAKEMRKRPAKVEEANEAKKAAPLKSATRECPEDQVQLDVKVTSFNIGAEDHDLSLDSQMEPNLVMDFDPELLLGKAVHGLFLLSCSSLAESTGVADGKQMASEETKKKLSARKASSSKAKTGKTTAKDGVITKLRGELSGDTLLPQPTQPTQPKPTKKSSNQQKEASKPKVAKECKDSTDGKGEEASKQKEGARKPKESSKLKEASKTKEDPKEPLNAKESALNIEAADSIANKGAADDQEIAQDPTSSTDLAEAVDPNKKESGFEEVRNFKKQGLGRREVALRHSSEEHVRTPGSSSSVPGASSSRASRVAVAPPAPPASPTLARPSSSNARPLSGVSVQAPLATTKEPLAFVSLVPAGPGIVRRVPTRPPQKAPSAEGGSVRTADGKPKAWSQVVAAWAKKEAPPDESSQDNTWPEESLDPEESSQTAQNQGHGAWQQFASEVDFGSFQQGYISHAAITTLIVAGLPPESTAESFMNDMDMLGLVGTYDFVHVPIDPVSKSSVGFAVLNFIDPAFLLLFCLVCQECQMQGILGPALQQGAQANMDYWGTLAGDEDQPVMLASPVPSQWCVNVVNSLVTPQQSEQLSSWRYMYHKTKICAFHKRSKCEMGSTCPYAHSEEELLPQPDLVKTRLCYNYFRGRCSDARCRFAHGSQELRAVWMPWWPGASLTVDGLGVLPDTSGMQEPGSDLELKEPRHDYLPGATFDGAAMNSAIEVGMMADAQIYQEPTSTTIDDDLDSTVTFDSDKQRVFTRSFSDQPRGMAEMQLGHDASAESLNTPVTTADLSGLQLRVRGTFMEVMQVGEESEEPIASRQRSWSDGDLPAFREAMMDDDPSA